MAKQILLQRLQANQNRQALPEKEKAQNFIDQLFNFLFNSGCGPKDLDKQYDELQSQLTGLIAACLELDDSRVKNFFEYLPTIYELLLEDAHAILNSDPAAKTIEEVMMAYPGFYAIFVYRMAHLLCQQRCTVLSRFFTEYAHSKTGIDIHPAAKIGRSFAIDHGTGIVIGETSVIGDHVKVYQGVTLGALSVSKSIASTKRHPTIEDGVVIYAGATILGGSTIVGAGSIIGGNVWLTYSVPPNSVVYHKSEVHVKDNNPFPEPINFVI
ncbi:MAG TPA: serine O-acetyltransferase EpsC [Flavisolibacter sp.]|jgi:serine O-acetyltransferase|nr:serine O-acetyltransferase EpsC [Flavisolibacter sp.]